MLDPSSAPLPAKGRRCALTILFSDLCDSTLIASKIDPETFDDFLEAQRALFNTVVARHRGIVARVDGDGALCLFGYPDMRDHGTRHALDAALDLHAGMAELESQFDFGGVPIRLHSAVNTGVVLLKDGDLVRGRFEVLGDVTNVAAKLCDHAAPNQIIIPETALGADRHYFEIGAAQKILLSGRARKTSVVSVRRRRAKSNQTPLPNSESLGSFIGRKAQLMRLQQWLAQSSSPESRIALLHGPAGIGKTRLVNEFLKAAGAPDLNCVRGACDDQIGTHPLQPFFQLLDQIRPDHAGLGAVAAETLQISDFEAEFRQSLTDYCGGGRCLIVIEDWHWASDMARLALKMILEAIPTNIQFLLSSRSATTDLYSSVDLTRIEVPPWTAAETSKAASVILGMPGLAATDWLEASSGGNPLFLEELCHGMRRGEVKSTSESKGAWLEALIQSRFSQLPQDQSEVLQAAAVLGQVTPEWLFEAVTGTNFNAPLVEALVGADFLTQGELSGTIRFKHGITKDAVYSLIGPGARRDWHGRAADTLLARAEMEGDAPYLDGLAYHCFAAGRTEQALDYSMRVGDIALSTGSLDRAQAHFSNAFKLTAKLQDRQRAEALNWSITNKFGLSCIIDPAPTHLTLMSSMVGEVARVGTPRQKARGAYWLGTLHYGLGNGPESVLHLTQAQAIARDIDDPRLKMQIDVKLAHSLFAIGHYPQAKDIFDRVFEDIDRGVAALDEESARYAQTCYGFMLADQGDRSITIRQCQLPDRVLTAAPSPLNASILTIRAAYCVLWGNLTDALAFAEQCLENAKSIYTPYQIMFAHAYIAFVRWKHSHDSEALLALQQAALWFEQDNSLQRTSLVYAMVADACFEAQDMKASRAFAARAVARVRRGKDHLGAPWAYRTLARLALQAGSMVLAQRYLKKAYQASSIKWSQREHSLTQILDAEIARARDDTSTAAALLSQAQQSFAAMGAQEFARDAEAKRLTLMPQATAIELAAI